MRFHRTPAPLTWIYPSLTWRIDTRDKDVYLTFDDGPVPGPTEFVLNVLRERDIKGTFFCIGDNIRKSPAIFKQIMEDGHATGNHTFNHLNGWKVSVNDYIANVTQCRVAMNFQPGTKQLFRPPYGRLTPSQVRGLNEYRIVMWDVLTYDFSNGTTPDGCLRGSLSALRPGSIVVFHDSHKAERNLTYALPRFVDECRTRGYSFKVLS